MLWFGIKGKLALRYIGLFKVVKRIGPMTYKLALPLYLVKINDVFHVLLLQKADVDASRVPPQAPLEKKEDLAMEVKQIRILDQSEKELINKKTHMVKVL
jgi:hypothetical protein